MEAADLPDEPMPEEEIPNGEPPSAALIAHRPTAKIAARPILTDDEIRRLYRIGSALAQSGMFPDAKTASQAFAKILMGRDLGLSPTQAMTGIHIVEGKPQLHYATMGAFVRAHGFDFRKKERTAERCVIEWTRDDWATVGEWSFTIEEAKEAGLKFKDRNGNPTNWEKRPKVMLFARALSQGVREDIPEVLGGIPVYVEGEIEPQERRVTGTAEPQGLDLGPKVEAVLIRAQALGHQGIADRATAEMALGDQPPQVVDQWVAAMHAELDKVDPEKAEKPEKPDEEAEEKPDGEPEEVEPDSVEQPEEKGDGDA